MQTSKITVTQDEARVFIERYGLHKLSPAHSAAMADAMDRMATAGLAVTRMSSKFDQPAPVFRVYRKAD